VPAYPSSSDSSPSGRDAGAALGLSTMGLPAEGGGETFVAPADPAAQDAAAAQMGDPMTSGVVETGIVPRHPAPAQEPPSRFAAWPDDTYHRVKELWSSVAGRNASAVERLLAAESEGAAVPAASTIRRWASDDDWDIAADAHLEQTRGRTLRHLQAGWLAALELAQATLIQGMTGGLDDAPYGGSARIKSAEVTLRTIERAGLLATLPDAAPPGKDDFATLTAAEQSTALREHWGEEGERRDRRR
jgi:hypothetical protein